ncbi:MAG TPA: ABC transporter permease [Gemmatimonadaceae bacterium]|nr:ABC transporter permease [Gemmatimonadaceae bacterium]
MDLFIQDVRYAFRSLRKTRGTTLIAAACLALGIGANTAIFSIVRAVLLEGLPYRAPSELVRVSEFGSHGPGSVSVPMYMDLESLTSVFQDVAAWAGTSRDLGDVAEPERLRGVRATTNLFTTLGARPLLGRTFVAADEPPSSEAVVVISEGFWRRRLGANARALGSTITLSNRKFTIVGIMPAAFDFPISPLRNDFWIPLDYNEIGGTQQRGNRSLAVVARFAPGVDSTSAAAQLGVLARRLAESFPTTNKNRGLLASSLTGTVVGRVRPALLILLVAVGLVLLIACANVANLSLARAAARRREIAIRAALGAARSRVVRQILTESVLLSFVGGASGLALAWWGLRAMSGTLAGMLPRNDSIGVDGPVLAFTIGVSVLTGIVVGVIPALRASQSDLRQDLSDAAGKSSASAARHRTLNTLIGAEIALSVLLLVGAGLVIRSFLAVMQVDSGFVSDHVLTFRVGAPAGAFVDTMRYEQFYTPLIARLRAIPGVRSVGATTVLPIQDGQTDRYFSIVGRPSEDDPSRMPDAQWRVVTPDYLQTLGIRVIAGRGFTASDTRGTENVMVVNQELVKRYFPGESPLGKQIEASGHTCRIIGVVKSVRQVGLDQEALPEFYVSAAQLSEGTGLLTFVISARGDLNTLAAAVRQTVHDVAPQQPVFQLTTMNEVIETSVATRRLLLQLLGGFALLALVLSAAGVYGVMSYGVTQRRREIGIRIALGARFGNVTGMVLRDVAVVAGVGIGVGVGASLALTRLLSSVLYGVGAYDALSFAGAPALILVVALVAGFVPALRAARVDPLVAMRSE